MPQTILLPQINISHTNDAKLNSKSQGVFDYITPGLLSISKEAKATYRESMFGQIFTTLGSNPNRTTSNAIRGGEI